MVTVWLGRFFAHCIKRAKQKRYRAEVRRIDPKLMSDAQISDWVHGRPVDWSKTGITALPMRGRVS